MVFAHSNKPLAVGLTRIRIYTQLSMHLMRALVSVKPANVPHYLQSQPRRPLVEFCWRKHLGNHLRTILLKKHMCSLIGGYIPNITKFFFDDKPINLAPYKIYRNKNCEHNLELIMWISQITYIICHASIFFQLKLGGSCRPSYFPTFTFSRHTSNHHGGWSIAGNSNRFFDMEKYDRLTTSNQFLTWRDYDV